MSTKQKLVTDTESEETTLDALCRLDDNSRGKWVQCVCIEVDCDELRFVFETVHNRETTKNFDVPQVYENSDVQQFFERVGYSAETASVMEGDTFWMQMDEGRVAERPPTRRDSFVASSKRVLNGGIEVPPTLRLIMMCVGGILLWPLGLCYFGYVMRRDEDWFFALFSTIILALMMLLLTGSVYEVIVTSLR